jgi:outer membrane receptor protein involved in Fe transport
MSRHPVRWIALAAALAASPAGAQDQATVGAAPAQESGLEEIVVTAQKRSENLQEVPASVSVLSASVLKESHIDGFEDITRATPGVSFGAGGAPGLDNIEIRGISSNSGSATVGIYLDEVSITVKNLYNGQVQPRLFDTDRVEVLRGPQGTLYGASSMGGTIRFISKVPVLDTYTLDLATDLSGTQHGSLNYEEQAVANVPIVDGVAALRLGVDTGQDSGYINNYTPAGQLAHSGTNLDRWTVLRASSLIKPSDDLTITPALYTEHEVVDDTSVYYPYLGLYNQDKLVREPIRDNLFIPSVTVTKDFGWADLTSISSYFWQQLNRTEDGTYYNSEYLGSLIDADPPNGIMNQGYNIGNLPGPEYSRTTTAVTTEEVRLASKSVAESGLPFTWLVGLLYSEYQIHKSDDAYVVGFNKTFQNIYGVAPENSDVFAGSTFPDDAVDFSSQRLEERQFAAFADATYYILPDLKASAGIRYAYARSAFTDLNTGYFGTEPALFSSNARFYAATPKFSVGYDVDENTALYATAAKGFRLGGSEGPIAVPLCSADLSSLGIGTAPATYGSDKLWSYEAGAKGRLLDNKVSFDVDGYYITWDKIQQTINLPTCGYTVTTNVGNAESYGFEVQLAYRPLPGLTLSFSGDVSHAVLTTVTANVGASAGEAVLNTPDYMATFRVQYDFPINDATTGFINADYDEIGHSHGAFVNTDPDYIRPNYGVLNTSLGFDLDQYTVSLYAKNLADQEKAIQHPSILFNPEAYTVRPRTVGVNVRARF